MKTVSLILIALFLNCAVFKMPLSNKITASPKYPGVDPQLAKKAEIKSRNYFVSKEEEEESEKYAVLGKSALEVSESLWQALKTYKEHVKADTIKKIEPPKERITEKVTDDADIIIILEKDTLETEAQNKPKLEEKMKQKKYDLVEDLLTMSMQLYLNNAMEHFQIARKKNKFNLDLAIERANIFHENYGQYLKDPEGFKRSAQELEKVIQFQKGYHFIFYRLGNNYEFLNDWQRAYENYKKALFVFEKADALDVLPDSARTREDTLLYRKTLFTYLRDKAIAETKLFMPDTALVTWYKAIEVAPEIEDVLYVERSMMDILWDDKNIKATVMRDSAYSLMVREEYDSARVILINLLPSLKTQKAKDETLTNIAWIEYFHQKQKQGALSRINNLVKNADGKKSTANFYEAPFEIHEFNYYSLDSTRKELIRNKAPNEFFSHFIVKDTSKTNANNKSDLKAKTVTFVHDSTYKEIFKVIAGIYFDYGLQARKEGRFNDARHYLDLTTRIDWPGRGRAYLGLVPIVSRKDPVESIKLCQKAFQFHADLNNKEKNEAFSLMIRLLKHRKIKRVDLARYVFNIQKRGEPVPWDYLITLKL